jgi:hypothetical protein
MKGNPVKTEIRGIYATALAKLITDTGYKIINPSIELQNRLNLEYHDEEPELEITSMRNLQGVEAAGSNRVLKEFSSILMEELPETVLRQKTSNNLEIEFPHPSKIKLEWIREKVTPTIKKHHYYKAFGSEVSGLVEMAENLLLRGMPKERLEEDFNKIINQHLPGEGGELDITHVKLQGGELDLGKASIEIFKVDRLRYIREIKGKGTYDGLELEREPGDLAVTEVRMGDYHTATNYYSSEGRLKGTYININTPVEVYTTKLRYIDLEIDLVSWPQGDIEIIDEEKLDEMVSKGIITQHLAKKAREEAYGLLNKLSPNKA